MSDEITKQITVILHSVVERVAFKFQVGIDTKWAHIILLTQE